ncbi:Rieske Fe-S protein [Rahnella inusitata]|nr:Rieske Fe-S protein [Rahnella inusitata]
MPSSRTTTDIPTADELFGILNRKLKKAAQNTTDRKLKSGEYVMYEGRPVPATVVARTEEEAQRAYETARAALHRDEMPIIDAMIPIRHIGPHVDFQDGRAMIYGGAARTMRAKQHGKVATRQDFLRSQVNKAVHPVVGEEFIPLPPRNARLVAAQIRQKKVK